MVHDDWRGIAGGEPVGSGDMVSRPCGDFPCERVVKSPFASRIGSAMHSPQRANRWYLARAAGRMLLLHASGVRSQLFNRSRLRRSNFSTFNFAQQSSQRFAIELANLNQVIHQMGIAAP